MQVLGVQLDPPFLRVAILKKSKGVFQVLWLKSATSADPDDVKQLYISFWGRIVSGLGTKNLLIRSLEIKGTDRRHLEEIISFQSEATSHFEPAAVLSVPHFVRKGTDKTEALLFTASREALRDHLLELKKWDIDPDFVSATPLALIRYALWKIPSLKDAFLIDLACSEWTCVWMEKGQLKKAHSIPGGIEKLLHSLWEDRKKVLLEKELEGFAKQIDLLQLKPHLSPHLSLQLNEMSQEFGKIIYSFHRVSSAKPILFTGRTDALGHLREYLIENVKDFVSGECTQTISAEEQKHAVSIGLALEHQPNSLQLRREEFFPQKNWKRAGLYCLGLLVSSLLISGIGIYLGARGAKHQKKEMISSLQNLLDRWDSSLKQTIFSHAEEDILDKWSSAVATHSKEYPYILQAPKVSEVFSWLNTHPLLLSLEKDQDPIEILSIRYHLLSFPTLDGPQAPYQAKVEMEFRTKSPLNARKLHEALLKGDERVDPTLEVSWEPLNDSYRTSFFLKNRSRHVP